MTLGDGARARYEDILREHYRHPRNQGGLETADRRERGRNPRCGDDIEVGVFLTDSGVVTVRFRARACSVCVASASLMTEAVAGLKTQDVQSLAVQLARWMTSEDPPFSEALAALTAVRPQKARHRCVLLAWDALTAALLQLADHP